MVRSPTALLIGACVASWSAVAAEGTATSSVTVKPGWDWTLPDSLRPVPYSGFVTWNGRRFHDLVTVDGVHLRWKQLNPGEGRYDWGMLTERIEKSRAKGMRLGLHLMGAELKGIPEWVMEKHRPPVFEVPVLQENQPWRLRNIAAWDRGVDGEFHRFLQAFGETGIPQSEDVVYGYIHGISPSRGEELWMRRADLEMYETQSGLTAELFADWLRRRIDAMCEAVSGTFAADADATVRLQLFGQGRGNHAPGLAGVSCFREIGMRTLTAEEVLQGREMDFRIETEGTGDVTVTMVRIVKPGFRD